MVMIGFKSAVVDCQTSDGSQNVLYTINASDSIEYKNVEKYKALYKD